MTDPGAPIEDLAQAFVVADGTPGARLFKGPLSALGAPAFGAGSDPPTVRTVGSAGLGSRNIFLLVGIGILVVLLVGGLIAFASGGPAHHTTSAQPALGIVATSSTTTTLVSGGVTHAVACAPGAVCSTTTSKPCAGAANCTTTTTHSCNAVGPGCPTRMPAGGQSTTTNPCVGAIGGCDGLTTTTACGNAVAGCGTTTTAPPQSTTTSAAPTTTTAPQCLAVTSVSPNQGGAGQQVTVTGCGFTNATSVTFGLGRAASFTVTTDTSISAFVPAGPSGTQVDVQVTTPSGTTPTGSADKYLFI